MAKLTVFEGKVANKVAGKTKCNICAQCFARYSVFVCEIEPVECSRLDCAPCRGRRIAFYCLLQNCSTVLTIGRNGVVQLSAIYLPLALSSLFCKTVV